MQKAAVDVNYYICSTYSNIIKQMKWASVCVCVCVCACACVWRKNMDWGLVKWAKWSLSKYNNKKVGPRELNALMWRGSFRKKTK